MRRILFPIALLLSLAQCINDPKKAAKIDNLIDTLSDKLSSIVAEDGPRSQKDVVSPRKEREILKDYGHREPGMWMFGYAKMNCDIDGKRLCGAHHHNLSMDAMEPMIKKNGHHDKEKEARLRLRAFFECLHMEKDAGEKLRPECESYMADARRIMKFEESEDDDDEDRHEDDEDEEEDNPLAKLRGRHHHHHHHGKKKGKAKLRHGHRGRQKKAVPKKKGQPAQREIKREKANHLTSAFLDGMQKELREGQNNAAEETNPPKSGIEMTATDLAFIHNMEEKRSTGAGTADVGGAFAVQVQLPMWALSLLLSFMVGLCIAVILLIRKNQSMPWIGARIKDDYDSL